MSNQRHPNPLVELMDRITAAIELYLEKADKAKAEGDDIHAAEYIIRADNTADVGLLIKSTMLEYMPDKTKE